MPNRYVYYDSQRNEIDSKAVFGTEDGTIGYVVDLSGESINHPAHYNTGQIEVIDFIEDQELGFHLGNAVKYICRAGRKNPDKTIEDLQKATWYLDRKINELLNKEE